MAYKNVLLCDTVSDLPVNVYEGAIAVLSDLSAVYYVKDGAWLKHDLVPGPSMEKILDAAYPVGTIYASMEAIDPGKLFGGVWEELKPNQADPEKSYRWKRTA